MSYMCRKYAGQECTSCGACRNSSVIGYCAHCDEPIYAGEEHYEFDDMDVLVHEDCLIDWAREFKKN